MKTEITIRSTFKGRLERILVKPSDFVEQGQPLFLITEIPSREGLNEFV